MEQMQVAYVTAIAGAAGCTVAKPEPDIDGIDLHLRQEIDADPPYESAIDLQLKATYQSSALTDTHVTLSLKRGHYDRLRTDRVTVPRLLVVMFMPKEVVDWHEQNDDKLSLFRCCYWRSLKNEPAVSTDTKTVHVPRSNVLSVDALCDLMYKVRASMELGA